jgi:RHH-type proline utilization regulon transcriptional repressor/proline dehydrogenase/delta 1-pyrroline-5-carboxylate dehydrogenase
MALPGPTGETNTLEFPPRGVVACIASDVRSLLAQARAALALGNIALLPRSDAALRVRASLGSAARVVLADRPDLAGVDAVLLDVAPVEAHRIRADLAAASGPIVPILVPGRDGTYDAGRLIVERTVTINTAAAGGNAALLSLAEDGQ